MPRATAAPDPKSNQPKLCLSCNDPLTVFSMLGSNDKILLVRIVTMLLHGALNLFWVLYQPQFPCDTPSTLSSHFTALTKSVFSDTGLCCVLPRLKTCPWVCHRRWNKTFWRNQRFILQSRQLPLRRHTMSICLQRFHQVKICMNLAMLRPCQGTCNILKTFSIYPLPLDSLQVSCPF